VDRALDLGGWLRRLFGLLRDEHLLRCVHHLADRLRLVLGGLAALGEVGGTLHLLVEHVGGLDHAQLRLGRLGRRRRRRGGRSSDRRSSGRRGHLVGGLRLRLRGRSGQSGGGLLGGLARGFPDTLLGGLALALLLLLAHTALLGQVLFLAAQQLCLRARFFLAALQFGLVDHRRRGLIARRRVVALDESALLAHLDLDRAGLAARIGLLDLAGRLACQRDLLALAARGRAVSRAQEVEQALLVRLAERVVGRRLLDAGRLQLLEQRSSRAIQLGCQLGDGGRSHCCVPCVV
jgi:hypothetical protein